MFRSPVKSAESCPNRIRIIAVESHPEVDGVTDMPEVYKVFMVSMYTVVYRRTCEVTSQEHYYAEMRTSAKRSQ